jgi:predicted ATPase/signal transduction histidine kinase/GAF domain-containing protein
MYSYRSAHQLREDAELILTRQAARDESPGALLLSVASERPPANVVQRLEREYSLRSLLDFAWSATPLTLARPQGGLLLTLRDPGGQLLSDLIGSEWELPARLRVAIAVTRALGRVHERGLVHNDVNPANILIDVGSGRAWFTGFGLASRLARERRSPDPPSTIVGTLAYMSPEQTGRLNRSVDSRSDLYSLGVTFYEMLVGALPFSASHPLEWVHCQIARQPPRASDRDRRIPSQVSAILDKLLAKPADSRYQTAIGLELDLKRCLHALEANRCIEPFSLGCDDVPNRLLIPEKLYGREHDVAALLQAFERTVAEPELQVVLLSGYSGIGKSSVVSELQKALVATRALFGAGKFDPFGRDVPYATLAQALLGLVRTVLGVSEVELGHWRSELGNALGPNGRLLTDLIPDLELIIGPQPEVPELAPGEAQNRFQLVLRQFVAVFASPEHPLVLFLDDLQWVDAATLKLIESLVTDRPHLPLLLIAAYRDNEVHPLHPLASVLASVRQSSRAVHEVALDALRYHEIRQLVADALHLGTERVESLARIVWEKAGGNPFFTIEFLRELAEHELLSFDASAREWTWNGERISSRGYTDNVVDLMAGKLIRLGHASLEGLKRLACLGNKTSRTTLALATATPEESLEEQLSEAVQAGVLLSVDGGYAFPHDRVHEAAYSLVPGPVRDDLHLRTGRRLLSALRTGAAGARLFDVVNQLNRALVLIDDPEERAELCRLNVAAATRAKASAAYANARTHLALAVDLSPENGWEHAYTETFQLFLALAECEFITGDFSAADGLFETLLSRAQSNVDRAAVYRVLLQLYQVAGRYHEGVTVARRALRLFGVELPETEHEIEVAVEAEHREVFAQLRGRSIAELVDGPEATDQALRATMDLLINAGPCAFIGSPSLYPLITAKGVNLSLRHGQTETSAFSYGAYSVIVASTFSDIPTAFELSKLSLRLNEKLGGARLRGSLLMIHGHFISFWKQPFALGLPVQEQALTACLEVGDLAYASYVAFLSVWQMIEKGDNLHSVLAGSARFAAFARRTNNDAVYQTIRMQQQFVACLQGRTEDSVSLTDDSFDEDAALGAVTQATFGCGIVFYHILKLILAYLDERYADALAAATSARPFLGSAMSMPIEATYHYYHALTLAALCGVGEEQATQQYQLTLADKAQKLALWAEHCPENFGGRNSLLSAELARARGHEIDALRFYEQARSAARQNGLVHDEAIACERVARYCSDIGLESSARAHFRDAHHCYSLWGAHARARALEARHPYLRDNVLSAQGMTTIGAPVEQLDLATVVRMLQSLAGELVLGKWISNLLLIALENAGAERGVLLIPEGTELRALADARTIESGVRVSLVAPGDALPELPTSVLHYVVRTHDTVLLDDAHTAGRFANDPYIASRRCRSLLCLPLVKQGKLAGILHLENNLAPSVFTPRRTAILRLLVAQAAMSLDNIRLYTDLERENEARKRTEEALGRSEAYLAEAQRLSRTGSFGWQVASGRLIFSDETYRLIGWEDATPPELEAVMQRIHPDDAPLVRQHLDLAVRSGGPLDHEHRFVLPDGSIKIVHVLGRPVVNADGAVEYVGAIMDVTEQREAEAGLQHAQAELARVMRVTALGELAASIAHEVNQPLAAIAGNCGAALNWLGAAPPSLPPALDALMAIGEETERAGQVLARIRGLLAKSPPQRTVCDVGKLVSHVLPLVRAQFERMHISLEAVLDAGVPAIAGDSVQLQQVILNLLLNAADACKSLAADRRRVVVRTAVELAAGVPRAIISVSDLGKGLGVAGAARIFDAFYTTKPDGMGMGLSISRSIANRHDGHLSVTPNPEHGVTFRLSLPVVQ